MARARNRWQDAEEERASERNAAAASLAARSNKLNESSRDERRVTLLT